MPATLAAPPPEAEAVLTTGMKGVISGGAIPGLPLIAVGDSAGEAFGPVPVYHLTADEAREGYLPDRTHVAAWRYVIVLENGDLAGCATIAPGTSDDTLVFSGYREDGLAAELLEALTRADQLAGEAGGGIEAGILECMALHFEAAWIHSPSQDIFIPLSRAASAAEGGIPNETSAVEILTFLQRRFAAGSGAPLFSP